MFKDFKDKLNAHLGEMLTGGRLYVVDVDKDLLWSTYLESFPPGANEIFRTRREHDCSCCRSFIRAFGGAVVIRGNRVISLWDFDAGDPEYRPSVEALRALVHGAEIRDAFFSKESRAGADISRELLDDGSIRTWDHFHVAFPSACVRAGRESPEAAAAKIRDVKNVFHRSLTELDPLAVDTVRDLIAQGSLYKGEEWAGVLAKFRELQRKFADLPPEEGPGWLWVTSEEVGPVVGKIRNHSIGQLLQDLTAGMELDEAVGRYEKIVAPTNYKRPKALFTQRMVADAERTVTELGLGASLGRRHARLDDITVSDILFVNRDSAPRLGGTVFDSLRGDATINPRNFDKLEEIGIDRFIADVLPGVNQVSVFFENRLAGNLVSLIAPADLMAPSLLKWRNGFSWAYAGNITDSMKERVKAHGGNVAGVLRFSIQWNEAGDNEDDLDAHCIEPSGNEIWFRNKGQRHESTGMLDVDIVDPCGKVAVENITWTDLERMRSGEYRMFVHCYTSRGARSGFTAEIEFDGQLYSFAYPKPLRQNEKVEVARVKYTPGAGFSIVSSLGSSIASRELWGVKTRQFVPVSTMMFSPNYWDGQSGVGHRHVFFMLDGCQNTDSPNGFFNEFLREDLMAHKRVFEALGAKMRVEPASDQLSGLGFSVTQRNSVVVRVSGSFTRTLKINF